MATTMETEEIDDIRLDVKPINLNASLTMNSLGRSQMRITIEVNCNLLNRLIWPWGSRQLAACVHTISVTG